MDHGPFSAVELLQQIASGQFTADNVLRDTFTNDERFIKDWEEFAPFAEQAKLNRDIVQEKKQLEAVVTAEKQGTQYKALIGAAVIGVFAAAAAGLWLRDRANKDRATRCRATRRWRSTSTAGSRREEGRAALGGPMAGGVGPGSHPILSGGMSCEGARAKYIEDYDKSAPPDLTAGAYGERAQQGHVPQRLRRPLQHVGQHLRRRAERARRGRDRDDEPPQPGHRVAASLAPCAASRSPPTRGSTSPTPRFAAN